MGKEVYSQPELGVIETPSPLKLIAAASGPVAMMAYARSESLLSDTAGFRNVLPEPFDVANHVANMGWTAAVVGLTLSSMAHAMAGYSDRLKTGIGRSIELSTEADYAKRKRFLAATAGALALAANFIGESNAIFGDLATSDPVDFAYGLLGGLIAYAATRPKFVSPEETRATFDALPATNEAKQWYLSQVSGSPKGQVAEKNPSPVRHNSKRSTPKGKSQQRGKKGKSQKRGKNGNR